MSIRTRPINSHSDIGAQRFHAFDVRDYGATGDGATDDSVAIQAAIDAAAALGGCEVVAPPTEDGYRCNVVLKSGVTLRGGSGRFGYLPGSINQTKFLAAAAGIVIDTPVTAIKTAGVVGLNIQGLGAGTAVTGIRFRDNDWGFVKGCQINNCADEGLKIDSTSLACVIEDVFTTNCVLNRSRAAVIGAVDIDGTDHYVHRVEAGISGNTEGTVQSGNLYCVALALRCSTAWITDCNGEFSDVGVYVAGVRNKLQGVRADFNYGHGFQVVSLGNRFSDCFAHNNSQDTTNTYDNFHATSASGANLYSNCFASDIATNKARYGFEDAVVTGGAAKNRYVNCLSTTAVTAQYHAASSNGSAFLFAQGGARTLTANSTTPDVSGDTHWLTANSSPTTITAFTGLVPGQRLTILCNDANTTIQHNGSTITLAGAGNKKLRSGVYYEFIANSPTSLREIAPFPLGVTADVGDANKTLQARTTEETQIWNTPLTAARAITLSTTGATAGESFHIVRTAAATGAFNLNVGTGPLKALTAGQWCDVTYNGSAWVLTAFGSL